MKPEETPIIMDDFHGMVHGFYHDNHEFVKCCNELAKYQCKEQLFASKNMQALAHTYLEMVDD